MPNPSPRQTEEFKAQQYQPQGDVSGLQPLAKKPLCVKLPEDVDAVVRSLPNTAEWLRRVVVDAARTELMNDGK